MVDDEGVAGHLRVLAIGAHVDDRDGQLYHMSNPSSLRSNGFELVELAWPILGGILIRAPAAWGSKLWPPSV